MIGWRVSVYLATSDSGRLVVKCEVPMGAEAAAEWQHGPRGHQELIEVFGSECIEMVRAELAPHGPEWQGNLSAVVAVGQIEEPWVSWHPDLAA